MGDTTIYLSQPNTATTVCFLMLAKHLLFTLLNLSFLCSLQAQHKVFSFSREIYRDSAIPYLPIWTHKRKIVHGKNIGNFGGNIKVRCVLSVFLLLILISLQGWWEKRGKSFIQGLQIQHRGLQELCYTLPVKMETGKHWTSRFGKVLE